jgi:hypothetical protein
MDAHTEFVTLLVGRVLKDVGELDWTLLYVLKLHLHLQLVVWYGRLLWWHVELHWCGCLHHGLLIVNGLPCVWVNQHFTKRAKAAGLCVGVRAAVVAH